MPPPTGTVFPGSLDTGTAIGTEVTSGETIGSAFTNVTNSAILALENAVGALPFSGTPFTTVGGGLLGLLQGMQNQSFTYAVDSGSVNAYAVTLSPTPVSLQAGQLVVFKAGSTNTGAATLAVNGQAAKPLVKNGGTALAAGDITSGQIIFVVYDSSGTGAYQVIGGIGGTLTLTGDVTGSGSGTITTTISPTWPGESSIATVGTITTGTWQGTPVAVAYGGTGATTASGARTNLSAAASGANSDITSLSGLTTALSVAQGGTGSTTASGARANLSAAASGANSDITSLSGLTTALSVAQGGTGSTTAAGARTNLSAAASGSNSDITSLSGLTTPLSVAQGGIGVGTLTGLAKGNGTSPFTAAVAGTDYLVGTGATAGTFPKITFNGNGLVTAGSQLSVASKTTTYTLTTSDDIVFASATSGAFTLTLPTAVGATGKTYQIKKTDSSANVVTIATTASQTIDGASTQTLNYFNQEFTVASDGSNWQIIAQVNVIPPGTIMMQSASGTSIPSAPPGWLPCSGGSYSATTYPALYNVIGTQYGGSGGNFNVPDLKGQVVIGAGVSAHNGSGNYTYNSYFGEESVTLLSSQIPGHTHPLHTQANLQFPAAGSETFDLFNGSGTANNTLQNTGGGSPHPNVQPCLALNYIIKT